MPLPPALAARLAKRGLLKIEDSVKNQKDGLEEVIAEDYDYQHKAPSVFPAIVLDSADIPLPEEVLADGGELVHETPACPNRINSYHTCSEYCRQRWGYKKFKSDPVLSSRHERLLRRYPLPDGWTEVGDPETGRFYYWNMETDEVSWLPPQHPRAQVSLAADRLKELIKSSEMTSRRRDSEGESENDSTDLDDEDDIDDRDFEELEREVLKKKQDTNRDRDNTKNKRRRGRDDLDPMDPAAYSDIPRGTWSTGLEQRGAAKTGVDATVAGPLFQQRPYPSPGAVLRMNKEGKKPT